MVAVAPDVVVPLSIGTAPGRGKATDCYLRRRVTPCHHGVKGAGAGQRALGIVIPTEREVKTFCNSFIYVCRSDRFGQKEDVSLRGAGCDEAIFCPATDCFATLAMTCIATFQTPIIRQASKPTKTAGC